MIQRTRIVLLAWLCLWVGEVYPQGSEQKIDDQEKTSSRINDMFSDPETLKRIQNLGAAIKGGKTVVNKGKEVNEAGGLKEYLSEMDMQESAEDAAIVYKNTKTGFWNILKDISAKVVTVIDKAQERVNQWQTTLPTIEGYYNVMRRWVDTSADVLRDFKISDLWDIERKWDRRLEDQVASLRFTITTFGSWMKKRYGDVNADEVRDMAREHYENLLMRGRLDDMSTSDDAKMVEAYIEVVGGLSEFQLVPKTALAQMGETFFTTREISERYHGIDEKKGTTLEIAMYDTVKNLLEKEERTMEDERQLAVYINKKRQMLAADMVALEQLKGNTMVMYSRLKLWDKEVETLNKQQYAATLGEIHRTKLTKIE